jgi:hypothetical protein
MPWMQLLLHIAIADDRRHERRAERPKKEPRGKARKGAKAIGQKVMVADTCIPFSGEKCC